MTILQTTFHNIDFPRNIVLPKNNEKVISHIQETLSNLSSLNIVQNKKLLEQTIKQVTKFIQKKNNFMVFGTGGSNCGLGLDSAVPILQGDLGGGLIIRLGSMD